MAPELCAALDSPSTSLAEYGSYIDQYSFGCARLQYTIRSFELIYSDISLDRISRAVEGSWGHPRCKEQLHCVNAVSLQKVLLNCAN